MGRADTMAVVGRAHQLPALTLACRIVQAEVTEVNAELARGEASRLQTDAMVLSLQEKLQKAKAEAAQTEREFEVMEKRCTDVGNSERAEIMTLQEKLAELKADLGTQGHEMDRLKSELTRTQVGRWLGHSYPCGQVARARSLGVVHQIVTHILEGIKVATDGMSDRETTETLPLTSAFTLTPLQEELIDASDEVAQLHEDLTKTEEQREAFRLQSVGNTHVLQQETEHAKARTVQTEQE